MRFFSRKCPEAPIWPASLNQQKGETQQTVTIILSSGHSLHAAFSKKCTETQNMTRFTESNLRRKEENEQIVAMI